jgi:2-polyprenyl-6-methoxyphenol hydroxylase-like FAD-dependent oxidoreductase
MKIAVIGGGTSGYIAAVHLTQRFPDAELLHIFDSNIPTIGVGEGTTPRFPVWFADATGLGFRDLAERCGATLKKGTLFDGWGTAGSQFLNRFQPTRLIGYHFDASRVVNVLAEYMRAERIDARAMDVRTSADGVCVRLADGTEHLCDYVFDARGFPQLTHGDGASPEEPINLNWLPTSRAILRWLPAGGFLGSTRASARPHGWVFQIPLRDATSAGYIFNAHITSDAEADADFTAFLKSEGVPSWTPRGTLNFPNFVRRRWFDGRVFWIGNSASFLEPLEATAIGTGIVQVRRAAQWIDEFGPDSSADLDELDAINYELLSFVVCNSLFVSWHYACGSRWDTPFWQYARRGLERASEHDTVKPYLDEMTEFVDAGRALPGRDLAACEDQDRWDREIYPMLRVYRPFGNFSELNFAQVGHGIGYYDVRHSADPGAPRRD